jgi:hypothetical protein
LQFIEEPTKYKYTETANFTHSYDLLSAIFAYRPYLQTDKWEKKDRHKSMGRSIEEKKKENALLQLPFTIVKRANVPCLEPTRNAMEVECVLRVRDKSVTQTNIVSRIDKIYVTDTPSSVTLFARR